jgi:hypothetical protein
VRFRKTSRKKRRVSRRTRPTSHFRRSPGGPHPTLCPRAGVCRLRLGTPQRGEGFWSMAIRILLGMLIFRGLRRAKIRSVLEVAHRELPCISLRRDIAFAPTGRPHTSPGSNPGQSHPDNFPRPAGTPHTVERQMTIHRHAAFLQNACLAFVRYPERCSGLVYDAPLGHSSSPKITLILTTRRDNGSPRGLPRGLACRGSPRPPR